MRVCCGSPASIPRLQETTLDFQVFAFVLVITIGAGVLFGLVPALGAARQSLAESLKDNRQKRASRFLGVNARNFFLAAQLALALMLVTAGGLLVRTFYYMISVDPGFSPSRVMTFELPLPSSKYPDVDKMTQLYHSVLQRMQAVPEVEAVGLVSAVPMGTAPDGTVIRIPDHPVPPDQAKPFANYSFASPGYFSALGTSLLRGRDFKESDDAASMPVTIINNTMAKKFWPMKMQSASRLAWRTSNFRPA